MTTKNNFTALASVNVNEHTKVKGKGKYGFTYLSWSYAVDQLMRLDPLASWHFHEPMRFGQTLMVACTLTAFNKPVYMWLPVIDHSNNAIKDPDAMAVNKAMMRCLVKAIAAHGLGLYIYAGEDLPSEDDVNVNRQPQRNPNHTYNANGVRTLNKSEFETAINYVKSGDVSIEQMLDESKFALDGEQHAFVVNLSDEMADDKRDLEHSQLPSEA